MLYKVLALRISNQPEVALDLAEAHEFTNPDRYAEIRGIVANILQDIGRSDEADDAYLEGMHVTGAKLKVSKAYGAFLMRKGDFTRGPEFFKDRFETRQRSYIPYENSDPDNLKGLEQLFLIGEQGVGTSWRFLVCCGWPRWIWAKPRSRWPPTRVSSRRWTAMPMGSR